MGLAREVLLEVDIPPGQMGIVLDKSIPSHGVLARFVPLMSGEKGLIELHPAICPGCMIVAINGQSIEHLTLDEMDPILTYSSQFHSVLTFKKFIVEGYVVHPVKLTKPYVPRPLDTHRGSPSTHQSLYGTPYSIDSADNQSHHMNGSIQSSANLVYDSQPDQTMASLNFVEYKPPASWESSTDTHPSMSSFSFIQTPMPLFPQAPYQLSGFEFVQGKSTPAPPVALHVSGEPTSPRSSSSFEFIRNAQTSSNN